MSIDLELPTLLARTHSALTRKNRSPQRTMPTIPPSKSATPLVARADEVIE
jgi:hypothetical protein